MTCSFTVNLWAWLVLGTCTYKQPEVAQKQKRCQDLLWQGPGPKAPDVEGDPSGTSTFLFDLFLPCCYLMCSHQPLLPKSWPQLWISASSREIKLVSILCSLACLPVSWVVPSNLNRVLLSRESCLSPPIGRGKKCRPKTSYACTLTELS